MSSASVVAVDRAVVAQAEILEHDARSEQVFHAGLDLVGEVAGEFSAEHFDELRGLVVQMRVGRVGGDLVEVARRWRRRFWRSTTRCR